jgi:hypothetical protein
VEFDGVELERARLVINTLTKIIKTVAIYYKFKVIKFERVGGEYVADFDSVMMKGR